jgi:CBS domain containing-hemolysin-like protein
MAILAIIWFGFLWLPARDVTKYGTWFAVKLAPIIGALLEYIHPLVNKLGKYFEKHRPLSIHTGLYEKEDLIDLIDKQKIQVENRIDKAELDMVKQVLSFGDKKVADYLIPRRLVASISMDDSVGPILMGEVHKSGHSRFPVYEGSKDNIVGLLYMRDIMGQKEGGEVKKLIRKDVVYIHEEQTLYDVLQAAVKVRQHLFIVVNSFEEYVGIISVEDVLEQIIGMNIVDEFDQYEDLRAVAAKMAESEHRAHKTTPDIKVDTESSEKDAKTDTK